MTVLDSVYCPNPRCPDRLATGHAGEFTSDRDRCAYCGEPLVSERPAAAGAPAFESLVPVTFTLDVGEAHLIRGALAARGFSAYVLDDHIVSANWLLANAVGWVKVAVPREAAVRARAALAGDWTLAQDRAATSVEGCYPACPKCESSRVIRSRLSPFSLLLLVFGTQVPAPFPGRRYICLDCGHRFR